MKHSNLDGAHSTPISESAGISEVCRLLLPGAPVDSTGALPCLPTLSNPTPTPSDGRIAKATISNMDSVLSSGILGSIRWDKFLGAEVLVRDGAFTPLGDSEITELIGECERLGLSNIKRAEFQHVLHMVAKRASFDSAVEWLRRLPQWDGISRVGRFLTDYLRTTGQPYEEAVGRYLWTGMVSRILYPGCKADMVPVLVGTQGTGKFSALSLLAPTPEHFADACLTTRASDLARKVHARTLIIWRFIRGIKGSSDNDDVKAIISSTYSETPKRSGKGMDRRQHRFLLTGTSNRNDFLRDQTGSRRYLPVEVLGVIDLNKIEADKDQLWAEALHMVQTLVDAGEDPIDFRDAERLAPDEHKFYAKEARWVDDRHLLAWLKTAPNRFSTQEALDALEMFHRWSSQADQQDRRDMAATLRQLGYKEVRTSINGSSLKRWCKCNLHTTPISQRH